MNNRQLAGMIQDLVETNRDGQEGYRVAAEHIRDPEIKRFCQAESGQRSQFATELESHVRSLGEGKVEDSGSISGALHRAWIDLKSAAGATDAGVLASVEQGEDAAKKAYDDVLKEDLPAGLRAIVQEQYRFVLAAHDRIRNWRDRLKAA